MRFDGGESVCQDVSLISAAEPLNTCTALLLDHRVSPLCIHILNYGLIHITHFLQSIQVVYGTSV